MHRRLEQAGAPQETRKLFIEDLHESRYRGSILRVEYDTNNTPRSDRGLLVLRGIERLWLLRTFQQNDKAFVTVLPGTESIFRQEVSELLR
jgi:hypothetical protein